jgi:hypothetical protein
LLNKVGDFAFPFFDENAIFRDERETCGIVATIFQALETVE